MGLQLPFPWAPATLDQSVPPPWSPALDPLDTVLMTPREVRRPALPFPTSFSHLPRVIFLNQTPSRS